MFMSFPDTTTTDAETSRPSWFWNISTLAAAVYKSFRVAFRPARSLLFVPVLREFWWLGCDALGTAKQTEWFDIYKPVIRHVRHAKSVSCQSVRDVGISAADFTDKSGDFGNAEACWRRAATADWWWCIWLEQRCISRNRTVAKSDPVAVASS